MLLVVQYIMPAPCTTGRFWHVYSSPNSLQRVPPWRIICWQVFRYVLYVLVNFRAQITLQWRTREQDTNMKDKTGVFLLWKVLLSGICASLLLISAGLLFLLVRQKELTAELLRLDVQMQVLSQSCRLQAEILPMDPAEAGELKKLHRTRRNHEKPVQSQDEKDMLMLMTYSMVPVRHQIAWMFVTIYFCKTKQMRKDRFMNYSLCYYGRNQGSNQPLIAVVLNRNISSVFPFGTRSMSVQCKESKSLLQRLSRSLFFFFLLLSVPWINTLSTVECYCWLLLPQL